MVHGRVPRGDRCLRSVAKLRCKSFQWNTFDLRMSSRAMNRSWMRLVGSGIDGPYLCVGTIRRSRLVAMYRRLRRPWCRAPGWRSGAWPPIQALCGKWSRPLCSKQPPQSQARSAADSPSPPTGPLLGPDGGVRLTTARADRPSYTSYRVGGGVRELLADRRCVHDGLAFEHRWTRCPPATFPASGHDIHPTTVRPGRNGCPDIRPGRVPPTVHRGAGTADQAARLARR